MASDEKAKEAIIQIDKIMAELNHSSFDTAWYLLSMAKLSLLEAAYPIDGKQFDALEFMSPVDASCSTPYTKKH